MQGFQQEKLLYRILSGKTIVKINDTRLVVHTPSLDLLYESYEIYEDFLNKSKIYSKEDLKTILIYKKVITLKDLDFLSKYNTILENFQKELFINFFEEDKAKSIRKNIKKLKEEQERLTLLLSKYDTYSKEGLANYAKSIFLISKTTYKNNKLYNFSKIRPIQVLGKMSEVALTPDIIRDLAKTSQWSNIWFSFKGSNIFLSGANCSIDQQLLMMWSRMYDGIRESTDCPCEEIINDNDAIDGWMLIQKAKRLEESKNKDKANTGSFNSKINNANEVFILAQTKEDIDRINAMNSENAMRIRENRMKQILEKGVIHHQEFNDVKLELMMQMNQQEINNAKGNRG
jgi:hypothetical protein